MATANDSLKAKEELDNNQLYVEQSLGSGYPFYLEGVVKYYLHRWPVESGASLPLSDLNVAAYYLDLLVDYTAVNGRVCIGE